MDKCIGQTRVCCHSCGQTRQRDNEYAYSFKNYTQIKCNIVNTASIGLIWLNVMCISVLCIWRRVFVNTTNHFNCTVLSNMQKYLLFSKLYIYFDKFWVFPFFKLLYCQKLYTHLVQAALRDFEPIYIMSKMLSHSFNYVFFWGNLIHLFRDSKFPTDRGNDTWDFQGLFLFIMVSDISGSRRFVHDQKSMGERGLFPGRKNLNSNHLYLGSQKWRALKTFLTWRLKNSSKIQ